MADRLLGCRQETDSPKESMIYFKVHGVWDQLCISILIKKIQNVCLFYKKLIIKNLEKIKPNQVFGNGQQTGQFFYLFALKQQFLQLESLFQVEGIAFIIFTCFWYYWKKEMLLNSQHIISPRKVFRVNNLPIKDESMFFQNTNWGLILRIYQTY